MAHDDPHRLVLEPVDDAAAVVVPEGAEACLCWPVPAGECLLPVRVRPAVPRGALLAVPVGPARVVQRRRYVRVREDLGVRVRLPGGSVLARGVDLSEAGLRCRLPASTPCSPGTRVRVSAKLVGFTLDAAGVVTHVAVPTSGRAAGVVVTVGIDLLLTEREADQVRRHVYAVQLRELAARRGGRHRW
ncbi:MAG TPA: PilZ domain-containing protein [Mycobacteriales bacterium]|nr:PilZ domain-containing protein [Mycobacteriales bacterium]